MSNRVVVRIGGMSYTVIADDSPEHVEEIAAYFDEKLTEIMNANTLPPLTATVLAGITVTDEYFKSKASADSLVAQMRNYVGENVRMRAEIGELRRELEKAKLEIERYRAK
ncbi:MAG TPA: cell division protein ZapA [Clostridiales bacterium]|jgi:cell division protein ZapA (FtsZ GTPase activity inhibitor)|nr:cell division protein ZapA [Clostridiales bacterium]